MTCPGKCNLEDNENIIAIYLGQFFDPDRKFIIVLLGILMKSDVPIGIDEGDNIEDIRDDGDGD